MPGKGKATKTDDETLRLRLRGDLKAYIDFLMSTGLYEYQTDAAAAAIRYFGEGVASGRITIAGRSYATSIEQK